MRGSVGLAVLAACSAGEPRVGGGGADGGVTPPGDGGAIALPACDEAPASCHDYVADSLRLPESIAEAQQQYGYDYDGDGKGENQLGRVLAAVAALGFDVQGQLDTAVAKGRALVLLRVQAESLADAAASRLWGWQGDDTDGVAGDNFDGDEPLAIDADSPTDFVLAGSIAASHGRYGPADFGLPIAIAGDPVFLRLEEARVTFDVLAAAAPGRLAGGLLTGVIPRANLQTDVYPKVAAALNAELADPDADPANNDLIRDVFDKDGDGAVSSMEVSAAVDPFLMADVDTDGDGQPDAVSVGVGFAAVTAVIVE